MKSWISMLVQELKLEIKNLSSVEPEHDQMCVIENLKL